MALEAFLESNSQLAIPLILSTNGTGGILEALSSSSSNSLREDDQLSSVLRMTQMKTNLTSDIMLSSILGRSTSTSAVGTDGAVTNLMHPTGPYLPGHCRSNTEPYISLPSSPMSSSDNPMHGISRTGTISHLFHGMQQGRKMNQLENQTASVGSKSNSRSLQVSLPVRTKQESVKICPSLKKPRVDVFEENIQQQQQVIHEMLLKELQDLNPQLSAMVQQHRDQNQLQQEILRSAPQLRGVNLQLPKQHMRNLLLEKGNQQLVAPILDAGICCRRFMQYLYHLRNRPNDNNTAYWRKFVSEYYAPNSRKRWCFSKYDNIEQHATGVFCPKSMETWCCDVCGSRSGRGLEATFETIPRLYKIKYECGMLDEMLFLDSPRACRMPSGSLVLEYRNAIQESVYGSFRVIHEGKLRIVFRQDLKILSWEYCAHRHEEFLLRRLVAPQVNQLVQAAQKYEDNVRNGMPVKMSSKEFQTNYNMFVSAGNQLSQNVELPIVNDLGYPKRFVRCLQIAEVVNSMTDIMVFSHKRKLGPIESLNKYSQGSMDCDQMKETRGMEQFMRAHNLQTSSDQPGPEYCANGFQMTDKSVISGSGQSGLTSANFNHQFYVQTAASAQRSMQDSGSIGPSIPSTWFNTQFLNAHFVKDAPSYSSPRCQPTESKINDNQPTGYDAELLNVQFKGIPPYSLPRSQIAANKENSHQALIEKLLQQLVASSKGKNQIEATLPAYQKTFSSLLRGPMDNVTGNSFRVGESSNAAGGQSSSADSSRTANCSWAASHGNSSTGGHTVTIKKEQPHSPELPPEGHHATGFPTIGDMDCP